MQRLWKAQHEITHPPQTRARVAGRIVAFLKAPHACLCVRLFVVVVTMSFAAVPSGYAAGWEPDRPIELIVPTGPAGGNDQAARTIQAILQRNKLTNVAVNVLNKPGGGGAVAFTYLNQYPGEARHVSVIPVTLLTNHITGRSAYTYTDFTPIAQLYSEYISFSVSADSPIRDGRDFIARLKQDASSVSFAFASSAGNQNHITIAMVAKAAGVDPKQLKTVVFNAGGQAITAVLGGHVDVCSSGASGQLAQMAAGRLRMLAVAAPQRLPGPLAAVPTWKELGLNVVFSSWRSMIGPKGLTPAQTDYWNAVIQKMIQTDEWKRDLEKNLWVSNYLNARDSKEFLDRQYADIKAILGELGLASGR